jgi:hypothetical protein
MPVTSIGHRNLVFLEDVTSPHTLCIDTGISSAAERASQSRFLAFGPTVGPALLQVLLLRRAPASGRLEEIWIRDSVWSRRVCSDEVICDQEPFWVRRHDGIGEAVGVKAGVGEGIEGWMNEGGGRI